MRTGDRGAGAGGSALLEYLRRQRWFGEKGTDVSAAELADSIAVSWPDSPEEFLVARARVHAPGGPVYYQLLLHDGPEQLRDALEHDAFRRGLVAAFAGGATYKGDGGTVRWIVESETDAPLKVPAGETVRLATAEQSNSSLFIGSQAVLKLFRRIAPGVHPDIEVTRFLTVERRFVHTPALLGSIHFADAQGAWAAGMLQEMVPGATDAWSHALERVAPWFADADDAADSELPFLDEAEQLGRITRAMHDALASGDHGSGFETHPVAPEDLAGWTEVTRRMLHRALDALGRAAERGGPLATDERARTTLARREELDRMVRRLGGALASDAGARIRVHGDYHLGQVLRSVANAFLVVDFEGEPTRPLEERRRPQSPLRDVAGMLRSLAYAAAVAGARAKAPDERVRRWEGAARGAFIEGYFSADAERRILPRSRENAARLIALFETEKAFYELLYELDHRPDWAAIPLRAIERMGA